MSRQTAKRVPLYRARIIETAIEYADEHGVDSLTMRALAESLGFRAMALYNHVKDKEDLLRAMVNEVADEVVYPDPQDPWKKALRRLVVSAYKMFLNHEWVAALWNYGNSGPSQQNYLERELKIMRDAGFSEELACRGFHALNMHLVGFALQQSQQPFKNSEELRELAIEGLKEWPQEIYPHMHAHIQFHLDGKDERSDFRYMLDLILDGLERDHDKEGRSES